MYNGDHTGSEDSGRDSGILMGRLSRALQVEVSRVRVRNHGLRVRENVVGRP